MHYSGILVVVRTGTVGESTQRLESLSGVEVHYAYPAQDRLIVVQETESVEGQQSGLRKIQSLPDVVMAELVYHQVDDSETQTAG